jgi:hypothetical protein
LSTLSWYSLIKVYRASTQKTKCVIIEKGKISITVLDCIEDRTLITYCVDLSGAKASKLELDTCALSIKRGAVCDLVKMAKSSGVHQSAFEGQILALYFLTNVVKPI